MPQIINHPLDGAYVRLNRAKEHLVELESVNSAYIDEEFAVIRESIRFNMVQVERDTIRPDVTYESRGDPLPQICSVLIGEIVYNLRASLDYLVYELAILDSGSVQKKTQFPIESTQNSFRLNKRHTSLKGVNNTHAAAIERLQPYKGVDWTKRLSALSNPDKHRHLIVSKSDITTRVQHERSPDSTADSIAQEGLFLSAKIRENEGGQECMYVELHMTMLITFEGGLPVVDTLQEIATQVGNTLADFKPEF